MEEINQPQQQDPDHRPTGRGRAVVRGAVLATAGALVGGALVAGMSANAATNPTPSTTSSSSSTSSGQSSGETPSHRGRHHTDETALTGDTATKVRQAVLAKYPGATVERLETDSGGVLEAHIVTSDGQHVTVKVDKSFAVTGTETGPSGPGGGDGRGGRGGPGGNCD